VKRPLVAALSPRSFAAWWWLALVPVAWGVLFWHLGERPLQCWDEARLAVNAAEMLRTHRFMVTFYQGQPDLWNTKPPLLIWLQALSLHLLGYSVWAFRLPTALAALGLTALVASFAKRWLGGPLAGFLSGLALLSSYGFVRYHVARTGDYEALLLVFTTAQVLAAFAWLQTRQARYLLLLGAAVGLAVLTKSVAGLFLVPGIVLEITRRGRLLSLFRQPATWAAVALAVGPPAFWYGFREYIQSGYWQSVWQNELGGRMASALEQNVGPWYFYLARFIGPTFLDRLPCLWVVVACWALAQRPAHRPAHRFLTLAAWSGALFLVLISAARTKLLWYDAPVYPLIALLTGGGLTIVARRVASFQGQVFSWRSWLFILLVMGPLFMVLRRRIAEETAWQYEPYGRFLQSPLSTRGAGVHLTALHYGRSNDAENYDAPLEFYALAFRHEHPTDTLEVRYEATHLVAGRVVLLCGIAAQAEVAKRYHTRTLYASDSCLTLQVLGPRKIERKPATVNATTASK
jgi:4-amino-4-deoxy-L-arabinose transferase-like glycosyltransferase